MRVSSFLAAGSLPPVEGLPALPFWVSPGAICHLSCGVFWERPPLPVTCGGMTDEWGAGSTHAPHCLSGLPWLQGKPGSLHLEQRALGRIRFQHQESRGSSFSTVSVHLYLFSTPARFLCPRDFQGKNTGVKEKKIEVKVGENLTTKQQHKGIIWGERPVPYWLLWWFSCLACVSKLTELYAQKMTPTVYKVNL